MSIQTIIVWSTAMALLAGCSPEPRRADPSLSSDGEIDGGHTDDDKSDGGHSDGGLVDGGNEPGPRATPTLKTGDVTVESVCAGAELTIPFTLENGDGEDYVVAAELSDKDGSFARPTKLASVAAATDGTIVGSVPTHAPSGTGYRVRVVIASPAVAADDNGEDVEVFGLRSPTLAVDTQRVIEGGTVRYTDQTTDVVSRTWTFPVDASVASSADESVDVSFSTGGRKLVQYEGVSTNGCLMTKTFDAVDIVGCSVGVPSGARVYDGSVEGDEFGGSYTAWVCGGGSLKAWGGGPTIMVEPGGTFVFPGGGNYTVYVRAGGRFVGSSGGLITVISEPGADLGQGQNNQTHFQCPSLRFDYSDSPENACVPAGTDPDDVGLVIGAIGAGPHCPGATLSVPMTFSAAVGAKNKVIAQLSDVSGDFNNAVTFGNITATSSGEYPLTLPGRIAEGSGYRLRLLTTHPPSIGSESEPFSVPTAAVASIGTAYSRKFMTGTSVSFTNTSEPHVSALWDFGDGASPQTSTSTDGTTTYETPGWKTAKLTITDTLGCSSTALVRQDPAVYNSGFEVLSCDVSVPSNARVLGPGEYDDWGGTGSHWMCGGSHWEMWGGGHRVVIEPNAEMNFTGGGSHYFYARAGSNISGASGGTSTLLYETGANVTRRERFSYAFECPVLAVDLSDAPYPGCEAY